MTTSSNVALASAGGVATASSSYSAGFPVSAVNNNERAGLNWGNGGGWNDATASAFPDWVQITSTARRRSTAWWSIRCRTTYTARSSRRRPDLLAYGVTDFTVQGWNGSAWVTLGTVSGNNLVKRTVSFSRLHHRPHPGQCHRRTGGYSRITEIEAWGVAAGQRRQQRGAGECGRRWPRASSSYQRRLSGGGGQQQRARRPQLGQRRRLGDATANTYPDWVQINFNGSKTIDRVVVYTLQDNYANPIEPTDTLTFSLYGVTDFTVQGWNGSAWVTLGTVSGNNLVKRSVSFTAFTTDRIRINVTNALASLLPHHRNRGLGCARPPATLRWPARAG